jgi:hypothetical protein
VNAEIIKTPRQAPSIKYSGHWFFKTSDIIVGVRLEIDQLFSVNSV